jgi:CHAD domain-containing protein
MAKKLKASPPSAASPTAARSTDAAPPFPVPLVAWMDKRVDELRDLVPKALRKWDEDAIHDARVNTRKLKAALGLLKPVLGRGNRRPFGRLLRRLRRRLGPLRDVDVMIGHLDELSKQPDTPHADAAMWAGERLRRQRDALHAAGVGQKEVSAVLARLGTWWGLREEVLDVAGAIDTLLAQSVHLQLDAFAEQSDRLTGRTPPSPEAAGDAPPVRQDPHELRIAGKVLRYTLDMAATQGHPLPAGVMKAFKAMQESLGLWHDHVVLSEQAIRLALDELLAHHDTALHAKVLNLAVWAAQTAADHLNAFATLWTGQGQELTQNIRDAFLLTRAAAPPATDGSAKPQAAKAGKKTTKRKDLDETAAAPATDVPTAPDEAAQTPAAVTETHAAV